MDTLALVFVLLVLLTPNEFSRLTPGTFVSVPLELLLGVAVLLLLPPKARLVAATIFGVALGLLALMKLLDMGFFAFLARPFDPVLDWGLLDDGMRFLAGSIGPLPGDRLPRSGGGSQHRPGHRHDSSRSTSEPRLDRHDATVSRRR